MPDTILDSLEPQILWQRFGELKRIPRPSKSEQQVMDYLRNWASQQGYSAQSDQVGNLCVQVPSSAGCEQAATVVLQNHVDIVVANAQNAAQETDAARGLIPIERGDLDNAGRFTATTDGGWICAPWSTLGADNGIGCAAAMAVCELDMRHPPLELLFTVDEEEGMSGALELDAEALNLRGRILINLDTEEDDELTIGSAGGCDVHFRWEASHAETDGWTSCELVLENLRGGHSGTEINSGRANAIRLMARALSDGARRFPLRIANIVGGDRRNAIPRSCQAVVLVEPANRNAFEASLADTCELLNEQFAGRDYAVEMILAEGSANAAYSASDSRRLIDLLLAIPTGVFGMTAEIPDLPETSNNLALIATEEQVVRIDSGSARSSYQPGMRDVLATMHSAARMAGAEIREGNSYPGWKPDLNSPILAATRQVYERLFPESPRVMAVHAGLECGVLASKIAELDCISFGPTIRGNHAPGEHVGIDSVGKSFRLLAELLAELA